MISADGTPIAYQRFGGNGLPLILITAALCDRTAATALAEQLAPELPAIAYDRRGRGDSGGIGNWSVQREIEDLAALIEAAGGSAAVYGHSSGAALALHAAAAGLPITKLVLHEPPFTPAQDGEDQRERQAAEERAGREQAETIRALLAQDRKAEAIAAFLTPTGMPQHMVEQMSHDPAAQAVAHTLPHDPFDVVSASSRGGATPAEQAATVTIPALLLCGGDSFAWMVETGAQLATAMPDGRHHVMPGQPHVAAPQVLAPLLTGFLLTT
ncbi:alpha/beta fold hydrolase [Nonomuraea sp. NPDC059023]|uniref:alpha/beta fold hydrolase n=1 Tax=Nonomuraea sp. NPDC059023 TaxID=3346706 RepID=UPI00369532B2